MSKIRTSVTRCLERPRHATSDPGIRTQKVGEKEPVPECQRGVLRGEVLGVGTALLLGRLEGSQHPAGGLLSLGWRVTSLEQSDPEGPDRGVSLTTMQTPTGV